ncbi:hypothetical protein CI109_101881 [Kwoniella shandongensis]|uniref:Uncharacterized protein n=1 Tax=Kwoniella shandongensis TaxID=1734106 RepID=A0A5M6BS80_9TREE|nr:uncharacterized protein CI109_006753 [Kwoniella shandongensis]KAA5524882.1 hypothetical protein CI109_006753 [Kwoniella shandongensis]
MSILGDTKWWTGREWGYTPVNSRDTRGANYSHLRSVLSHYLPSVIVLILGIAIGINFPLYLSVYTRRPSDDISLLPHTLPPPPPPSTSLSLLSHLPAPAEPIPNIVHYVYGLASEPQPDFPYFAYLAMRSAMTVLKPDKVMFHCITEPRGYWWDRVKDWEGWEADSSVKRGEVEIVQARDVQWIGSDRRPVKHFAHKADIIRLEVLLEHGGIYLDIDTFVLRPFADYSLLLHDTVLAMEARELSFFHGLQSDDEMEPKGLCNAVIVAKKGSKFLKRWLDTYEVFREDKWTEHSVEMPWTLARMYPTLVTVLSERAFFWPLWTEDHIHAVYETKEYDFEKSGQLAYHAWESKARSHLSKLDPATINKIDSSFTRMARRFREPDEERRWLSAGQVDGSGSRTEIEIGAEETELEEIESPTAWRRRITREAVKVNR